MHTTPADTVHNAHKRVAGSKERKKMKFLDLLFSLSTKWRLYFIFVMMSLFLLGLQNESSKEASGSVFFASSHRTLDGPDWPGCIWWGPASGRSRTVMFDWQVLHPDFWSGSRGPVDDRSSSRWRFFRISSVECRPQNPAAPRRPAQTRTRDFTATRAQRCQIESLHQLGRNVSLQTRNALLLTKVPIRPTKTGGS